MLGLNVLNLATEKIVVANGPVGSARIASVTTVGKGEIWVGYRRRGSLQVEQP
jgi:hypothetical protein